MSNGFVVDYNLVEQVAQERGLDTTKLFIALNWYCRLGGMSDGERSSAVNGSAWTARAGRIHWNDRTAHDRFMLAALYERA